MAETEFFWNQLLDFIDEGTVVPVVGEGLLRIAGDDGFLYPRLARDLASPSASPVLSRPPGPLWTKSLASIWRIAMPAATTSIPPSSG